MSSTPGEDEWLVLRSRQGDPEALDALLRKWQRPLWAYAFRMTGSEEAAYDVLQEALISIARDLHRLHSDAAFGAWAYQITRNKSLDCLRQICRRQQGESALAREQSVRADPDEAGLRQELLPDLLASLPDAQERTLLQLRFEQGFTQQEIASMLNVPLGTVKSRLHAIITRLRSKPKESYEPRN